MAAYGRRRQLSGLLTMHLLMPIYIVSEFLAWRPVAVCLLKCSEKAYATSHISKITTVHRTKRMASDILCARSIDEISNRCIVDRGSEPHIGNVAATIAKLKRIKWITDDRLQLNKYHI